MLAQRKFCGAYPHPLHIVFGMEHHVMEMLAVFVGGKQVAQRLHGQVVNILPKLAAQSPYRLDSRIAGDCGLVRIKNPAHHDMVNARNESRFFFNINVKADMNFHVGRRGSGKIHFNFAGGIFDCAGNNNSVSASVNV